MYYFKVIETADPDFHRAVYGILADDGRGRAAVVPGISCDRASGLLAGPGGRDGTGGELLRGLLGRSFKLPADFTKNVPYFCRVFRVDCGIVESV